MADGSVKDTSVSDTSKLTLTSTKQTAKSLILKETFFGNGKLNEKHRYWLFCFDDYYPSGGFNDVNRTSDDFDDIMAFANKSEWTYVQIFDKNECVLYDIKYPK